MIHTPTTGEGLRSTVHVSPRVRPLLTVAASTLPGVVRYWLVRR